MTISKAQQKKNRKLWVEALRSGKYKQGVKRLRDRQNRFCCLGVLADISGCEWEKSETKHWYTNSNYGTAPEQAKEFVGLDDGSGYFEIGDRCEQLSSLNDSGASFQEIADIIESEPEGLFK